jgi:hypothetical protein
VYIEKHQLYETALEIFYEADEFRVCMLPLGQSLALTTIIQEILNLYGEWLFERREFSQSALGIQSIVTLILSSLMGRSVCGCAKTTTSNACLRKGAFMARIIRARAASRGRPRGHCRNGIPCSRYALLPGLALFASMIALQRI